MTGAEALAMHTTVQELLRRQAAAVSTGELDAAEALSAEIGHLLDRVAPELGPVEDAMRERLLRIAGTLEIESEPGAGTALSACVPAITIGAAA